MIRIAAVQTPEFLGDLPAALRYINRASDHAKAQNVLLLAFPEGFLQGYFVQEEQARSVAIDLNSAWFRELLADFPCSGPMLVVGMIEIEGEELFNTAIVIKNQELIGRYRKHHLLPSEKAFTAGQEVPIFEVQGLRFGVNICYDTNFSSLTEKVAGSGADLVVCCANNMLKRSTAEKYKSLHNLVRGQRCRETGLWLISSDVTGERGDKLACFQQ